MLRRWCALKSFRGQIGPFLFVALSTLLFNDTAHGGSIRYELPDVLGQYIFGSEVMILGMRVGFVETSFGYDAIEQARLVIVGTVTPGRARGDGILREAVEFELLPSVGAILGGARSITEPPAFSVGSFRLENLYIDPFVPQTTPLPNPDGYPTVAFSVAFGVGPSILTSYPPAIPPFSGGPLVTTGVDFDVPIVANVTEAYVILEGAQVPEPSTWVLVLAGAAVAVTFSRRRRSVVADNLNCAGGRR